MGDVVPSRSVHVFSFEVLLDCTKQNGCAKMALVQGESLSLWKRMMAQDLCPRPLLLSGQTF